MLINFNQHTELVLMAIVCSMNAEECHPKAQSIQQGSRDGLLKGLAHLAPQLAMVGKQMPGNDGGGVGFRR